MSSLPARLGRVVLVPSLLASVCGAFPVSAQGFVIPNGESAGQQVMSNAGDSGRIEGGGNIETFSAGEHAVVMQNDGQSLVNDGTVETFGDGAHDVFSQGDMASIVNHGWMYAGGTGSIGILSTGGGAGIANSGRIETAGTASYGVIAQGGDARVDNSGVIDVSGVAVSAILGGGPNLSVTNSGAIFASGTAANGIIWGLGNDGLSVVNSGTVAVSGLASNGIAAAGTGIDIVNAGTVYVSGQASSGILTLLGASTIDNSGRVIVFGTNAAGIAAMADGSVVTNSGGVFSDNGAAIYFGGSNTTLNLLGGTAIQGPIAFNGSNNLVTFGPGLNALTIFFGDVAAIDTGGRPFVVDGDAVGVVDTTGFAAAAPLVEDLTGDIADAVATRVDAARDGQPPGRTIWATAFGSLRAQGAGGSIAGFDQALGGLVTGVDIASGEGWLGGLFVGGAAGSTSVDFDAQQIDHGSVFGGGYVGYDDGSRFVDVSATFGALREKSSRRIAENFVYGGLAWADASYSGLFVSPSLTVGAHLPVAAGTLSPSLRLRYAGLFLDGYEEEGADAALQVARRDVHVFTARAQAALALAPREADWGTLRTTLRAGLDATTRSGGDVSATLLGQDIAFSDGGRRSTLRLFAGADFTMLQHDGLRFDAGLEAGYGSDRAFVLSAGARVSKTF